MRYENWDVLLFPEGSRVPIQEFQTACFVTEDLDSPYLQDPTVVVHGGPLQIPVVATFIPSLPAHTPFRVSIHNWDKPRPSRLIERMMQPDDVLLYEVRVFIDGNLVSGGVFGTRGVMPYILDMSNHVDREGNRDFLRFPPFHHNLLRRYQWLASESLGRIQIVLSEGFSRPQRSPPFERVKDILIFAFQHAPQALLEDSEVSWPNPKMWSGPQLRNVYRVDQSIFIDARGPEDTHAHSPTRAPVHGPVSNMMQMPMSTQAQVSNHQAPIMHHEAWAVGRAFPVPQLRRYANLAQSGRNPQWSAHQECYQEPAPEPFNDPFVSDAAWRHRGARSSREDVPMPDYNSSSSRVMSSMTGISYEHSQHSSISAPMDDEQYNMLLVSMTPTKAPTGARAPSNTPSEMITGGQPASATPATQIRSAAGKTQGPTRGSGLRELSQPSSREVSGSAIVATEKGISPAKPRLSPSRNAMNGQGIDKGNPQDKENGGNTGPAL